MGLFRYQRQQNGPVKVVAADIDELHESLLLDKYNFGAPRVSVAEVRNDATMILQHDSQLDGRGLDAERGQKVLEYIKRVWRRPVILKTVNANAKTVEFSSESPPAT
jgi:stage V sporulation protein R